MKLLSRISVFVGTLVVVTLLIMAISLLYWSRSIEETDTFKLVPLKIIAHDWFDAGVVDINSDGFLDIYTSNHNSRQNLLIGNGDGSFTDVVNVSGFNHLPGYPGLENSVVDIDANVEGLYIYFENDNLVLKVIPSRTRMKISGSFSVSSPVSVKDNTGFDITVVRSRSDTGARSSVLRFSADVEATARIDIQYSSIPIRFELADDTSQYAVFIGHEKMPETNRGFELLLRDRHGIAWSDLNSDGNLDAFITRGGLSGGIGLIPEDLEDELLITMGGLQFEDKYSSKGFRKRACPGRSAKWVDINNDEKLDIYVVCGRKTGGFWEYIPPHFSWFSSQYASTQSTVYSK